MKVLVTGGAGFIGSNFLNGLVPRSPEHHFVNLDLLTYAANPKRLDSVATASNYRFVHGDIADWALVDELFARERFDLVVHFAAESHVDRSIYGPRAFLRANVEGTLNLLEACRKHWPAGHGVFHHIGTDEVFGSVPEGLTQEGDPYRPSNPYAATKAASDHFVRAWGHTYGLQTKITTSTNNYGPRQFPEKLVPLVIARALAGAPIPLYGDGAQIRDWIYVDDHCEAIWAVALAGRPGATYVVGSETRVENRDLVRHILRIVSEETGRPFAELEGLITPVPDRPGHDRRYASACARVRDELGWKPRHSLEEGLRKTVRWYIESPAWLDEASSPEYSEWIARNYGPRH